VQNKNYEFVFIRALSYKSHVNTRTLVFIEVSSYLKVELSSSCTSVRLSLATPCTRSGYFVMGRFSMKRTYGRLRCDQQVSFLIAEPREPKSSPNFH